MNMTLLPRPQQNLAEWAAVYIPAAGNPQITEMARSFRDNEYSNLHWLAQHFACGTLYTIQDIQEVQATIDELLDRKNYARVTLDDVARLWWLNEVYKTYDRMTRVPPSTFAVYMRLLSDIKKFMLITKQDTLRKMLLTHTNTVNAGDVK